METEQLELFPNYGIKEEERLYVIGNGFDVHHYIKSKYSDFKNGVCKNENTNFADLMDTFFSNSRDFWNDIEKAFGEYDEKSITDFCKPENPEDFKYDHPGQWQAGIEDVIPYIFEDAMNNFRDAFCEWVKNIDITFAKADLQLPPRSKYLSFNYTETLASHRRKRPHLLQVYGFGCGHYSANGRKPYCCLCPDRQR